jgi:hypothetical protein
MLPASPPPRRGAQGWPVQQDCILLAGTRPVLSRLIIAPDGLRTFSIPERIAAARGPIDLPCPRPPSPLVMLQGLHPHPG